MNERFKELAKESLLFYTEAYETADYELEKFAKLIVKEMVNECATLCVQHAGWTPELIAHQVKKHFGIEE